MYIYIYMCIARWSNFVLLLLLLRMLLFVDIPQVKKKEKHNYWRECTGAHDGS